MVSWIFLLKILPKNFHNQQAKAYLLNLREKSYRKFKRIYRVCPYEEGLFAHSFHQILAFCLIIITKFFK